MNIKDLRYFVAVAEQQHFGKAAVQCNISQPTLSMQLKKLESYLGVTLLERHTHHVQLTDTGQLILSVAREAIQQYDDVIQLARHAADPEQGELKIGLVSSLGSSFYKHVLDELQKLYPQLHLHFAEDTTQALLEAVGEAQLDCVVVSTPAHPRKLQDTLLVTEPLVAVMSAQHPLAGAKELTLAALMQSTVLVLPEGHCLRYQVLKYLGASANQPVTTETAVGFTALYSMVAGGWGVSLIPQSYARDLGNSVWQSQIVQRSLSDVAVTRDLVLYWRETCYKTPLIEQVAAVIPSFF